MKTLKVGQMPGKLVEVAIQEGMTAREIFNLAEVEISNHEIRLDGEKISLDTRIENGSLLVGMRQIKGNNNTRTIKLGLMPGKLVEVTYQEGQRAIELFGLAGIELANHEIRLDGNKINIDDRIEGGNLLVGLKQIKGNVEAYVSEYSTKEIEFLTGCVMPTVIDKNQVTEITSDMVMILDFVLDKEVFDSVYELKEIEETVVEEVVEANEVVVSDVCGSEGHVCKCSKKTDYVVNKLNELKDRANYYWTQYKQLDAQVELLEEVLANI